jgi:hypothetical protein
MSVVRSANMQAGEQSMWRRAQGKLKYAPSVHVGTRTTENEFPNRFQVTRGADVAT